ncbi:MAG: flagellin [Phycisphaerales bacterium]|nr:flagellin [Phycisphaerales bacterium]
MTRINTNTAALVATRQLSQSNQRLQLSLERLSTGLRINRGADDPAGLIISQNLRSEIESVRQAIANSQRASNVVATTEGALDEVASLLNDIQSKIIEAANDGAVSDDEIRANQLQIDSAVESITRIANTTTFGGRKLLNGSLGYITSGVVGGDVTDVRINGVQFGTASFIPVEVVVTQSAQHAELQFQNSSISESLTLELAGPNGVTTLSLLSGSTAQQILDAVNLVSDATGVSATFINAGNQSSGIVLNTEAFGSDSFVQVQEIGTLTNPFLSHTRNTSNELVSRNIGRDVAATVNGASTLGKGLELFLNTNTLSLEMRVQEAFNTAGATSFAITGGGARFQLGPGVDTNQQVNIGVQSAAASRLGNDTIGYLNQITSDGQFSLVVGQASRAALIIEEAIQQVSSFRGRLGAFEKNTLDTNVNQLTITMENLISSESAIRDLDFALETSNLTRNQILVSAGTSVLAIANQTPQSVLALLQ